LRELRRVLEELNLRVSAVGFHTRRGYDVQDDLERRVAASKAAMNFAQELGASVVVNQIGRVPEESQGPAWELLVQVLTDLANYGHRVGARLAAQTGAESGADLARLIAALPPQGIGVELDPGHLIVNGFSPLEAVHALGANILHVHARDGVRDASRGRGLEVPLGRGSADFPALLGALEEHNYRGYVTAARDNADDPLAEIGDAVKYLANL
jgi:sugar phosphate isomerase/epimerase